jgi:hypothetical protein
MIIRCVADSGGQRVARHHHQRHRLDRPGHRRPQRRSRHLLVRDQSSDRTVKIADPANFGGTQLYWLSFDQLATLIPPKGYSA